MPMIATTPMPAWSAAAVRTLHEFDPWSRAGRIHAADRTGLRARGLVANLGEICELRRNRGAVDSIVGLAEVVDVGADDIGLCCFQDDHLSARDVRVIPTGRALEVPTGQAVLGRVLDGFGVPIDQGPSLAEAVHTPVDRRPPLALSRRPIDRPLRTGLRAIDGLLTCGRGQRLAVLAPAGTGKSTLLASLAQQGEADVVVIALVGERGREVADLMSLGTDTAARRRRVVVAATADRSALERVRCAFTATAIAESFRERGAQVLLLMDSLTRWIEAQRELGAVMAGLSHRVADRGMATDTSAWSAVTPALASLLERAGNDATASISAFYTVLCDESRATDPIAEQVRAVADGHLQLSRSLANAGHFPAIDVLRSVSRLASQVCSTRHQRNAAEVRAMLARLEEIDLLFKIGEYAPGSDAQIDRAIALRPAIEGFLREPRTSEPGTAVDPARSMPSAASRRAPFEAIDDALEQLVNPSQPAAP